MRRSRTVKKQKQSRRWSVIGGITRRMSVRAHHGTVLRGNPNVLGDQMVLTPAFWGAEPSYADHGPFKGIRIFQDEERAGLRLMRSFSADQQKRAIVAHSMMGGDLPEGRRHFADNLHLGGASQDRGAHVDGKPVSDRSIVFISKSTPEDDEFVLWLAPRLEAQGYENFRRHSVTWARRPLASGDHQNVDQRVVKIENTLQQLANVLVLTARQDERLIAIERRVRPLRTSISCETSLKYRKERLTPAFGPEMDRLAKGSEQR